MISCRQVRALVVEEVRGAAVDVDAIVLHADGCEACRAERARWQTFGELERARVPALGSAARDRIAARLRASAARTTAVAVGSSLHSRMAWAALAAAAVVVAALGAWRWQRVHPSRSAPVAAAPAPAPSRAIAPPAPSVAPADRVLFAGAELTYGADTRVRFRAADNEIAVDGGALEIHAASLPRPLRLDAHRFRVVLRHAHVIIAADVVRVLDGSVEIYTHDAEPLAIVGAGAEWRPSDAPAAHHATRRSRDPAAALDEARAALARGDGEAARAALGRVSAPPLRAETELFRAESYLVDGDADRAIAAYAAVARAFAHSSAGESAAFAAAELLVERGRRADAERALGSYLAQYPEGRFAREARERLADLRPAQ